MMLFQMIITFNALGSDSKLHKQNAGDNMVNV